MKLKSAELNVNPRKTVAVAMSGGVDSSVAAAMLLERGFQVIGLTMNLWDFATVGGNVFSEQSCCSPDAIDNARAVCNELGIPHYTIDLRSEFEETVINNFVDEYLAGRTPNPCILCNARVKWGALLNKAITLGAQFFATGHYARVEFDANRGRYILRKSLDQYKEQSYALWLLSQDQLSRTILPLGQMKKSEAREFAANRGLKSAKRAESQEICFIPDNNYGRFLSERVRRQGLEISEGEVVDSSGKVLGKHRGCPYYTIGQRRGLGIAVGRPVYVVHIDPEHNRIVVGGKDDLLAVGLEAEHINWVSVSRPEMGASVTARIRYNDPGFQASITVADGDGFQIYFTKPQRAVTPGQSVVLFRGDEVLGGGIICSKIVGN